MRYFLLPHFSMWCISMWQRMALDHVHLLRVFISHPVIIRPSIIGEYILSHRCMHATDIKKKKSIFELLITWNIHEVIKTDRQKYNQIFYSGINRDGKKCFHLMREWQLHDGNYREKSTDREQEKNELKWERWRWCTKIKIKNSLKKGFVRIGKNQFTEMEFTFSKRFFSDVWSHLMDINCIPITHKTSMKKKCIPSSREFTRE